MLSSDFIKLSLDSVTAYRARSFLTALGSDSGHLSEQIRELLEQRHGNEDITIITQDQMVDTLSGVLNILTLAVAALERSD